MDKKMLLFIVGLVFFYFCNKGLKFVLIDDKIVVYLSLWNELENYLERIGRSDDICFLMLDLGWVINNKGILYKIEDGGELWKL